MQVASEDRKASAVRTGFCRGRGWAGGSKTGEALGSSARLQSVPAPLGGPSEGSYWKANSEAGRPAGQERALGHPCRRGVPRDRVTRQGRSPSAPPACRARPLLAAGPSCALRGVLQHRCLGRLGAGSTAPATVTGSVRRRGRTSSGRTAGPVENHWPRGARVCPSPTRRGLRFWSWALASRT